MAVAITRAPNLSLSNCSDPTRGDNNRIFTITWEVPEALTDENNNARATSIFADWKVDTDDKMLDVIYTKWHDISETSGSINLDSFRDPWGNTYTRNSFYPVTDVTVWGITVFVTPWNSKGEGYIDLGSRRITPPPKPTISAISFNTENGHCSATITAGEGTPYQERKDIYYRVTVKTRTGSTVIASEGASESNEFTVSYDASDYQNLAYDQYIKVTVEAKARGLAGDSKTVSRNYYLSYPSKATITRTSVSAKDSTGKLTVGIKTNQSKEHPVDKIKLEYIANTEFEKASDITGSWSDAGITDDGECTALAMPVDSLIPSRGRYTWIRATTYHAHEAVLYRYSDYVRLKALETPPASAADSAITIISATSSEDGDSAVVQLAWNRTGADDATGTELSWSDEADTWKSTKEPDDHEFEWSDGPYTSGGVTYQDSAKITIKGLSEGKKYYIKARRYFADETKTYGNYSNTSTVIPSKKPTGVVANCDKYVADGSPLSVTWSFSGGGTQTAWQIVKTNGTVIASGRGSIGGTKISAKRLKSLATNNSISFTVQVSTGSGFVSSESKTVKIISAPTLTLTAPTTLTAQPYQFTASSSRPCNLIVIVTAQGISGQRPEGRVTQLNGDTVYSDRRSPAWSNGSATIRLPKGLDFWQGGRYTLSVVAVDRETGLQSKEVRKTFRVAWENRAVYPASFVTLTPRDEMSGGKHLQAVDISLTAPTGSRSSDVYDIYRMDGGKACLIGKGFSRNYTVTDNYAPFSDNEELFYRVALRTIDGDVKFADIKYTLHGAEKSIRLDWQEGSLELPYGTSIGDSYKKNVEFRQHMDGSVDGYWNKNIERTSSFSSSIIKLIQPSEIALARKLARYAGAVFVRTSNGSAFTADVQVTDLSVKNKQVTAIAIDATEVGLTDEFMLPNPTSTE